jgi:uncharacterized protein HemY
MKGANSISELLSKNRTAEARKVIEKYYKDNPKLYFYYLGISFLPEKDYNKVILFLGVSKNKGLNSYLLYYNLGLAYLNKEDYKNAEENFKESIDLNRNFLNSYINLAHIYVKRNDNKKAYRIIKTALVCSDDSRLYSIEKALLKRISADI